MSSSLHESVLLVSRVAFHRQEPQTILLDAKIYVHVPQYHGLQIDLDRVRYICIYAQVRQEEKMLNSSLDTEKLTDVAKQTD